MKLLRRTATDSPLGRKLPILDGVHVCKPDTIYNLLRQRSDAMKQLFNDSTKKEPEDSPSLAFFEYVVDGVLLSVICTFGIIGNIFILFVLSRDRNKSSITYYLQHLALYDLLFLVCKIILHVVHVFSHQHKDEILRFYHTLCRLPSPVTVAVIYTVRTGSIWTTVGMSVERYVAICHPLKAITFCTSRKSILFNLSIAFLVMSFNVPRFFENETLQDVHNISNQTYVVLVKTTFGKSFFFVQVYNWMDITMNNVFPSLALLWLNISVYRKLRKARHARQKMTLKQETDAKLAPLLFCIVAVFLICYTPSFLYVITVITGFAHKLNEHLPYVLHLTEAANSSVNFIVYYVVGKSFRETARQVFCGERYARKSSQPENVRTISSSLTEIPSGAYPEKKPNNIISSDNTN